MRHQVLALAILTFSTMIGAQSRGDVITDFLPIASKDGTKIVAKAPLPPGKWIVNTSVVRNSNGENTRAEVRDVVLYNIEEKRLRSVVFLTFRINDAPIRWEDDACADSPRVYAKNNFGTGLYRQKCVNVWMNTFLQSPAAKESRDFLASLGATHDANQMGFRYARHGDVGRFFIYEVSFFPTDFGLDNPLVTSLADSAYYPTNIRNFPEKEEFAKAIMAYGEAVAPLLDDFYLGKEVGPLPEFRPR